MREGTLFSVKVLRLCRFVLLVRGKFRFRWVWSNGGMILGGKHYIVWVVGE
jgi:hypothetical protein